MWTTCGYQQYDGRCALKAGIITKWGRSTLRWIWNVSFSFHIKSATIMNHEQPNSQGKPENILITFISPPFQFYFMVIRPPFLSCKLSQMFSQKSMLILLYRKEKMLGKWSRKLFPFPVMTMTTQPENCNSSSEKKQMHTWIHLDKSSDFHKNVDHFLSKLPFLSFRFFQGKNLMLSQDFGHRVGLAVIPCNI